jgi:hypothetical protein
MEPDSEILRIWAEWLALTELDLDHPVRAELARRRATDARALERGFRYARAMNAFQRALQLAPLDLDLRRDYAELFRSLGYNASYLQELRLLRENGADDRTLLRTIEVFENALSESVSRRWGIDQFTLKRSRTPIALYLTEPDVVGYSRSGRALLTFLGRTLRSQERFELIDSKLAATYAEAFGEARSQDVDFFIHADVGSTGRLFAIQAGVFVARTGTAATQLASVRAGPDYASAAVDSFAGDVAAALPVSGEVVRRENRRIVIDLGARDGVEEGQTFDIVAPGDVSIAPDAARLVYGPDVVAGTATITAVDDLISEADLDPSGVVDLVTTGDAVIARRDEEDESTSSRTSDLFPILYERVRRLR